MAKGMRDDKPRIVYDPDLIDTAKLSNITLIQAEPKTFTWDNARDLAIVVRDGLLMIIKGIERVFDIGKK